jgi:hypothetical protein
MEDQPTGQTGKNPETTEASNSPNPSLTDKKETTCSDKDANNCPNKACADVIPKTRWQRFAIWTREIKFSDAVMLLLTAFIAVGTIISAKAIYLQYHEMHDGSAQTDKIIAADQRIATAMENAVGQAGIALNASINASRTDQRAWASIKEIKLSKPLTVGRPAQISVTVINTGKTPALDTVLSEVRIGPSETDRNRDLVVHDSEREVIAPNNTDTFFANATYDDDSIRAILVGTIPIYIRGKFEYKDVFGATHTTAFCAYYPTDGSSIATGYFFNCKNGSSMD